MGKSHIQAKTKLCRTHEFINTSTTSGLEQICFSSAIFILRWSWKNKMYSIKLVPTKAIRNNNNYINISTKSNTWMKEQNLLFLIWKAFLFRLAVLLFIFCIRITLLLWFCILGRLIPFINVLETNQKISPGWFTGKEKRRLNNPNGQPNFSHLPQNQQRHEN